MQRFSFFSPTTEAWFKKLKLFFIFLAPGQCQNGKGIQVYSGNSWCHLSQTEGDQKLLKTPKYTQMGLGLVFWSKPTMSGQTKSVFQILLYLYILFIKQNNPHWPECFTIIIEYGHMNLCWRNILDKKDTTKFHSGPRDRDLFNRPKDPSSEKSSKKIKWITESK